MHEVVFESPVVHISFVSCEKSCTLDVEMVDHVVTAWV